MKPFIGKYAHKQILPLLAAFATILVLFFSAAFLYRSINKPPTNETANIGSTIWPSTISEKKEAILNLAKRAKTAKLFDAEIKYIVNEYKGVDGSMFQFTSSEQSAVLHAIGQQG